MRPTWFSVDLDAVAHNVRAFRDLVAPAEVCTVVKADGYGHGAPAVARAALGAGATWLAVALVEEAAELRDSGLAAPILVLSEPRPTEMADVAGLGGVRPTLYTQAGVDAYGSVAGVGSPVHLKVDTGMHRVGVRADEAVAVSERILDSGLELEGVFSHCAVADEPGDPLTTVQVERFEAVLADLATHGIEPPIVHLANTATALTRPEAGHSMVRIGLGAYGVSPGPELADRCRQLGLRQAITVHSRVVHLQNIATGEGVGYGHRWTSARETRLATVPVGYADGLARAWGMGGAALVGGRRRPLRGVVSMDSLVIEVDEAVAVGDEVVLLGAQGDETIEVAEVSEVIGQIPWEVLSRLGRRPPRLYT